ncbi:MAG: hypothetical protein AB7Y46_17290 [Armatimonadota bacterium]
MFVTMGLWAIQRSNQWLLLVAVVVGATKRESVLVLAGYYLLMAWPGPRRTVLLTALLLVVGWAPAYAGLRLAYSPRPYYIDMVMLGPNLHGFGAGAPRRCCCCRWWSAPSCGPSAPGRASCAAPRWSGPRRARTSRRGPR